MGMRLIAALILLLGGSGLAYIAYLSALPPAPEVVPVVAEAPPAMVKVIVAAAALQAGTLIDDDDFREQEVPAGNVPANALVSGTDQRAELRGAMLRRFIAPGEVIGRDDVVRPRDRGFLAAVMRPGTRAVSVGVDTTTGAAGLIAPGDLVDVILTQELESDRSPTGRRVVGETVLTAVRVIAVDQQLTLGSQLVAQESRAQRGAHTVTLEVTPEEAEHVAVAQRLGRLTLTVRSIDATTTPSARRPSTLTGADVSPALRGDEPVAAPRMRLIQGNSSSEVLFR